MGYIALPAILQKILQVCIVPRKRFSSKTDHFFQTRKSSCVNAGGIPTTAHSAALSPDWIGTPIQSRQGGRGNPISQMGVPPHWPDPPLATWEHTPVSQMGVPPSCQPDRLPPPPPHKYGQTENITFRLPSDARG